MEMPVSHDWVANFLGTHLVDFVDGEIGAGGLVADGHDYIRREAQWVVVR